MRLFIAILLSPEVRETLFHVQTSWKKQGVCGKFSRPENLHLTLAFLGETQNISGAQAALDSACTGGPFELIFNVCGHFGDLWWAGAVESPCLKALTKSLQNALIRQDFPLERRPFRPHVTLVRHGTFPQHIQPELPQTSMTVQRVSLMRSERMDGHPVYTEIYKKDL